MSSHGWQGEGGRARPQQPHLTPPPPRQPATFRRPEVSRAGGKKTRSPGALQASAGASCLLACLPPRKAPRQNVPYLPEGTVAAQLPRHCSSPRGQPTDRPAAAAAAAAPQASHRRSPAPPAETPRRLRAALSLSLAPRLPSVLARRAASSETVFPLPPAPQR